MQRRIISCMMIAVILICLFMPATNAAILEESEISARAALVLECSTNTVLYSKAAHEKLPMASTTKVMTALVAIEYGSLDEIVATASEAYGIEGSSIYLNKNERMSLRDLLYGLMLRSGNDAAIAIAIHIGGSVDRFVELMNDKAKSLGAVNTNFTNPNGLPDDSHYTTAYDLALICSAALKNETFKTIVSTQYHTATTGDVNRIMMNKNKLLWQYDGAIGIKTGYTEKAGKCLTFAAQRDGMTIVGVVLDCPNMFPDSMELMNCCFESYEMYDVIKSGTIVVRTQVENTNSLATLVTASGVSVPVKKTDGIKLRTCIRIKSGLCAPIKRGANIGVLELYREDKLVATVDLIALKDVNPSNFIYFFNRIVMQFAS